MKPTYLIFALLLLVACSQTTVEVQTDAQPTSQETVTQPNTPPLSQPAVTQPSTPTRITDLKTAFSGGSFTCTATVQNIASTVYVKDGKVKSATTVEGQEMHSLLSTDDIWTWGPQGCFHMKVGDIPNMPQQAGASKTQTKEEMANTAVNVDCQPTTLADSFFTPPSPCQDLAEMLKGLQMPAE